MEKPTDEARADAPIEGGVEPPRGENGDAGSGEAERGNGHALAAALGDTAEITALDPAGDEPLREVADPHFPVVLRGYDRAAVDAYVADVSQLVAELHATRSPRAAVKKALDRVGRETAAVLQRAQEAADEITAESRARADDRLQEADREAKLIVAEAHEQVRRLDADTEALWRERRKLIEDVRGTADRLGEAADEAIARFPSEEDVAAEAKDSDAGDSGPPTEPLPPPAETQPG